MKRLTLMLILLLFLWSMLVLFPRISLVKAEGAIFIRAYGAIDPPTANITSLDNVTYTFTDNINDTIVVERSNIIIDGKGYTLQGNGTDSGFSWVDIDNVTIKNTNVKNFSNGIYLRGSSSNNHIFGNNITNNENGVYLYSSSNYNVISGNGITANVYGIGILSSSSNIIFGNNITNNERGIQFEDSKNNTIIENNITNSSYGIIIYLNSSSNIIYRNNIENSHMMGMWLGFSSSYNSIFENNVENNTEYGIVLRESSNNNTIYHNNFINNTNQVYTINSTSVWDDGVEGNYWSNYTGADLDHDGIGDSQHIIDVNNTDGYPLMGVFRSFNTSLGFAVNVISNSIIEDFQYFESNRSIRMYVSNMTTNQTFGFCRVSIPHVLMDDPDIVRVLIDSGGTEVLFANFTLYDNGTYRWMYFGYEHSIHEVIIQSDITPPTVFILSPENATYIINNVPLAFTVSEATSWIGYSLGGQVNVTISGNQTLFGLFDGLHSIVVYVNDTAGNMGASSMVYFTVDANPPIISILSPENKTYSVSDVSLTFVVSELTSWMGYGLDGQANVTIFGNMTLTSLPDGVHYMVVYANDTVGHMGVSDVVYFAVDTTRPDILDVNQFPRNDSVLVGDEVRVNATVTDALSGVKSVVLNYTNGNGTWIAVEMMNIEGNVWSGTIPAFPYGTYVNYTVVAEDNVGNTVTSEEVLGYQCQYYVIPEFASLVIVPLFMFAVLLAVVLYGRKRFK